ncbi:hypothetical protein P154DRAFT_573413 [Amniculicola lignicola CBS 123094]|uniref:Uncharacterized protein n=1 Tax=Amniculicola lignicola CBS 123094 TaxID=1392246 RepID=A0A6A5WQ20_9PLEO|nr:hypothetical protein P154DRAFT_573413 [Amniculicola lignicola CBS 123094]
MSNRAGRCTPSQSGGKFARTWTRGAHQGPRADGRGEHIYSYSRTLTKGVLLNCWGPSFVPSRHVGIVRLTVLSSHGLGSPSDVRFLAACANQEAAVAHPCPDFFLFDRRPPPSGCPLPDIFHPSAELYITRRHPQTPPDIPQHTPPALHGLPLLCRLP